MPGVDEGGAFTTSVLSFAPPGLQNAAAPALSTAQPEGYRGMYENM